MAEKLRYVYIFVLGILCFLIFQIIFRMGIINYLSSKSVSFNMLPVSNPFLYGFILALSAGVFEEFGRYILKKLFMYKDKSILKAVTFGLGHSLMEICYIFIPVIIFMGIGSIGTFAILERVIATVFHILMTIIIWNGFINGKENINLIIAILIHTFIDFLAFVFVSLKISIMSYYFLLILIIIVCLYFVKRINVMGVHDEKIY